MKKEIRTIDKERGIVQVTTTDERWYSRIVVDETTGLQKVEYLPSSTWISSFYPKGIHFWKWLAEKGWDEAEAIKHAAGNRGSHVHEVITMLESGAQIPIDGGIKNIHTGQLEQLTIEEIDAIMSFLDWHQAVKPKLLASEMTVFGDGYAGTLDRIYRIDGKIVIIDFKTSQHIWEEHKLQVSSYNHAHIDYPKLGIQAQEWENRIVAILQLGYKLNKIGMKYTEVEDKYDLFLVAKKIWDNEVSKKEPKQRDYPLILKLEDTKNG